MAVSQQERCGLLPSLCLLSLVLYLSFASFTQPHTGVVGQGVKERNTLALESSPASCSLLIVDCGCKVLC